MNVPFYIARRFFFRRGKRAFIHGISWLSVLTLALGLMALTVGLSTFNGLEQLLKSRFENFAADLRITPIRGKFFVLEASLLAEVLHVRGVRHASPVIEHFAMARYNGRHAIVKVKGMRHAALAQKEVSAYLRRGEVSLGSPKRPKALLGEGVAYQLGVSLEAPLSRIHLAYPQGTRSPFGKVYNEAAVNPAGFFSVEASVDEELVIVPLRIASTLVGKEKEYSAWELYLQAGADKKKIMGRLQEILGADYQVLDQEAQHAILYKLFRTEKSFLFLLFVFVLLTASFNSSFSLCMLIIEKKKEIRVLVALGMKDATLRRIFLYQACLVNAMGGLLGLALGLGICYAQKEYQLFHIDSTQIIPVPYPVAVSLADVLLASCTLIPLCWLSSLYPAYLSQRMAKHTHQSGLEVS